MASCCCKCGIISNKDLEKAKVCKYCYPNLTVSPITVKIAKIPRVPPYLEPRVKQLDFNELFPKLNVPTSSQGLTPAANVECAKCLQLIREKEIQLIMKENELAQVRARYGGGGARHNYKGIRGLQYQLYLRDQEIARLKMEEAKRQLRLRKEELKQPPCEGCSGYLRRKQEKLREIEQEIVKQMASPYIKISPNPCDCCSGAIQPKRNEKARKRNQKNCFKELQKRERDIRKKEKDIDSKIKALREKILAEAEEDLKKIPNTKDLRKEIILKCKCACTRKDVNKKNIDPCSYKPNALGGSLSCSMPFWNTIAPRQHDCSTRCCVEKLVGNLAACAFRPPGGWGKKKHPSETCTVMRMVRWWLDKQTR